MKPAFNQTIALKKVLGKFVDILYISNAELELMHDFILSDVPVKNMWSERSEIYETLVYLRDLALESNFKSVDQLFWYFESQIADINEMMGPFLSEESGIEQHTAAQINDEISYSYFGNSVKAFSWQKSFPGINTSIDRCNQFNQHDPVNYTVSLVGASYKDLNLASFCLRRFNLLHEHCRQNILPNSNAYYYKNYFEDLSLTSKFVANIIFFVKGFKGWIQMLKKDFKALRSIIAENIKRKRKSRIFYETIFESIRKEQIQSKVFKTAVSRLILTSKMNSPTFMTHLNTCRSTSDNVSLRGDAVHSDFSVKMHFYKAFSEKKWSVLKSPAGCSWITSDNPGFSVDLSLLINDCKEFAADPFLTAIDANRLVYFPLSREYCLRLEPPACGLLSELGFGGNFNNDVTIQTSSETEVQMVNNLVASSKPEVIISDRGIQLLQESVCR